MNRILFIAFLTVFFSSCSNDFELPQEISPDDDTVTLNLSFALGNSLTRAFFDNTMVPEPWENEVKTLHVGILNSSRKMLQEHSFDKAELESMTASLVIPYGLLEAGGYVYAVANAPFPVFTGNGLPTSIERFASQLNGDFDAMMKGSIRKEGFPMSANKEISVNKGRPTNISIELKRTVSKVAVVVNVDPDAGGEFAKALGITRVHLQNISSTSYVYEGYNRYTETSAALAQTSDILNGQYRNLFYTYETSLKPTAQAYIVLAMWLDKDGDLTTLNDKFTMNIKIPMEFSGGGVINRNSYYRVTINLKGLELADIESSFAVLDWADGGYEEINYGDSNN